MSKSDHNKHFRQRVQRQSQIATKLCDCGLSWLLQPKNFTTPKVVLLLITSMSKGMEEQLKLRNVINVVARPKRKFFEVLLQPNVTVPENFCAQTGLLPRKKEGKVRTNCLVTYMFEKIGNLLDVRNSVNNKIITSRTIVIFLHKKYLQLFNLNHSILTASKWVGTFQIIETVSAM